MFSKKTHVDIKKSIQKINDPKKDICTRYRHLRNVLDHIDTNDAKIFFESHYSNIYHIFYENFISAEINLKQKVHKTHKEDLDNILAVLEKIIILCPDLLANRWQCHSLTRIISKLLHPGNSWRLRREAIKFFIIWYQCLGENAPDSAHAIFTTLVPGFPCPIDGYEGLDELTKNSIMGIFYSNSAVTPVDIHPIYPPPSGEKPQEDPMKFYMDSLLEFMVTQISRIQWRDAIQEKRHHSFKFLFEKFKLYYLPVIFRDYSEESSVYKQLVDLPNCRPSFKFDVYLNCRVCVIKWVANFTHDISHKQHTQPIIKQSSSGNQHFESVEKNTGDINESYNAPNPEEIFRISFAVVREVMFSTRENVNFVIEILRQGFLLPFSCSSTIRRTLTVYKDWIQNVVKELPPFMLEPTDRKNAATDTTDSGDLKSPRLRNDSYVGAITREYYSVRAGAQNPLRLFITHAANVFLLENRNETGVLLEEQVDTCKRVLNLYRYMVMHTPMDLKTWDILLLTLLKITSTILTTVPPKKKEDKLGGRLAQAVFQTLIVTWIKANLNVVISAQLWEQFCDILSSLTQWEELVKEWAKTMETLTRVLARHVYNLDLNNLPLNRLTEQKAKRRRNEEDRKEAITCVMGSKKLLGSKNTEVEVSDSVEPNPVPETKHVPKIRRSISEPSFNSSETYQDKTSPVKCDFSVENDPNFENVSLSSCDNKRPVTESDDNIRKWRSLDAFNITKHGMTEGLSRSASPSNNSVKDSALQIEVQDNTVITENQKSVIAGGNVRGWLPDVAIILWKRMLGAIGNINNIKNPNLHAQVIQYLNELSNTMIKMKMNQGISEDNQKTPPLPELVPPLTIFAPWCFETLTLPSEYSKGKVRAYELLCQSTLAAPDSCLSRQHIAKFYNALHAGLTSNDKNIVNVIIRNTIPQYFSRQLPGYTLLIPDFVDAAHAILLSSDLKQTPRAEAASALVTALSFADIIVNFPAFKNKSGISGKLKNKIVEILLHSGKKEPTGLARCISLSGLGIYIMLGLEKKSKQAHIREAFSVLLLALKFNHEVVAQVATDIILIFSNYANILHQWYPELPFRAIEVLTDTLSSMMPIEDGKKRLLTSMLMCLAEWTMALPLSILLQPRIDNKKFSCLLFYVFKILEEISIGGRRKCISITGLFDTDLLNEFERNIVLDNLKTADEFENHRFFDNFSPTHLNSTRHSLQVASKMITSHLLNYLGQFPIISGASRLSSSVTEQDDNAFLTNEQLNTELFSLQNILMFVNTNNLILSLIELPALEVPAGGVTADLVTAASQVRILLRTLNGKFCWDASILHCTPEQQIAAEKEEERLLLLNDKKNCRVEETPFVSYFPTTTVSQQYTIRHRLPHILPTADNSAPDMDNLDDLLQYIGFSSPECLEDPEVPRNMPSVNSPLNVEAEQETISTILSEKCVENEYLSNATNLSPPFEGIVKQKSIPAPFQYSRLFLSQMGYLGWDMRTRLYLLQKTEKVLREIRNLDSQFSRETHKIAVIYVANGQEDKVSILSNINGSQKFEDFVAALAWEVELENHSGFMGGLHRNKTTGVTAPYFATSFLELILHVSTRMTSESSDVIMSKTRHLGNDEVHIVWSEHSRDYRRGIIPTEFCDILIVIYPLPHNLYRIQISKKAEVPYFGPCFEETVVHHSILPNLVRMIAISASRAKRSMLPFYQQLYEERYRSLDTIVRDSKTKSTFEEFAAQVYSPGVSLSPMVDSSLSRPASIGVSNWQSTDSHDDAPVVSISPKSHKKMSSKSGSSNIKRGAGVSTSSLTPPESPTLRRTK